MAEADSTTTTTVNVDRMLAHAAHNAWTLHWPEFVAIFGTVLILMVITEVRLQERRRRRRHY